MRLGAALLLLAAAIPVAAQAPQDPSKIPLPLVRTAPVYPELAARDGTEGFVELEIEVLADGSVGEVLGGIEINLPAEVTTPPVIKHTPQGIMLVPASEAGTEPKKGDER